MADNIEVSKKGVTLKWAYIAVILGALAATAITPHVIFRIETQAERDTSAKQAKDQAVELAQMKERMKTCEDIQQFLLKRERERENKRVAPNTIRRFNRDGTSSSLTVGR